MLTPYISMAGIGKSFGPVHALKSVDLTIYPTKYMRYWGKWCR
jgi:D-allose transport system ATP-binding protein